MSLMTINRLLVIVIALTFSNISKSIITNNNYQHTHNIYIQNINKILTNTINMCRYLSLVVIKAI